MARNVQLQILGGILANRPTLGAKELYWATDTGQLFIGNPAVLINAAGSGGGTFGTATLNFGSFPGGGEASVAVTGQAGILAGSFVEAWVLPAATADHSADEHLVDPPRVVAANIVPGTGFTIYGYAPGSTAPFVNSSQDLGKVKVDQAGRTWGAWNIAWRWN